MEIQVNAKHLLGGCVLGDGLGALRDGVLGQFTRQEEADSCLDLPGGDGGTLVVMGKTGSLCSNALKMLPTFHLERLIWPRGTKLEIGNLTLT